MTTEFLRDQLQTALAGRYDIEREIGRGGMATVYLARDVKHERNVALKLLNPDLGAVLGAERFLTEIRVTANLQHPNLLPLFDSGSADGLLYYVMPYVEGESLRARLDRERQLPVDEAVRIAAAVADALEYAHGHGVIHRDLKPENILLQHGQPMVADFGIALAVSNAGGQRVTQTGLSLGTPQYMSPEQATGDRVIDRRADIYSLGAVTYEMLAGEPPHSATTAQAVIAKLMTEDPRPITVLRRSVPANVEAAIRRSLEKLPADRFSSARDFAAALRDEAFVGGRGSARADSRPSVIRRAIPWAVAALAVVVGVVGWLRRPAAQADRTVRIPIALGEHDKFSPVVAGIPIAMSPDDRLVAYAGNESDTKVALMMRSLDQLEGRALAGTEGIPYSPTFSPNGQWIAVNLADKIVRVPVGGGQPIPIATLNGEQLAGMIWLPTDSLVASVGGRLVTISTSGGPWRTISTPDSSRDELAQWGPHLLPDKKSLAYVSVSRDGIANNRISTVALRGGRQTITGYRGTTILGSFEQHLLWVTVGGTAVAVPAAALAEGASAEPVALLEGVLVRPGGAAKASMSERGSLAYERGESGTEIVLVDEHGGASPLVVEPRTFIHPRFSPDGKRIAVAIRAARSVDVWLIDVADKTLSRLTADGNADFPEWSPDGKRVMYRLSRRDGTTLRWMSTDGTGVGGLVVGPEVHAYAGAFAPDGRGAIYRTSADLGHSDIFLVSGDSGAQPTPLVVSPYLEAAARVSRDGKWMAYISDESGTFEVYARPFPGPGPRIQISQAGGSEPQWSSDGHTLFYRNGRVMYAADLAAGPTLSVTGRRTLFTAGFLSDFTHANYDVAPDGHHLLMLRSGPDEAQTIVVLGWASELRARLGYK